MHKGKETVTKGQNTQQQQRQSGQTHKRKKRREKTIKLSRNIF